MEQRLMRVETETIAAVASFSMSAYAATLAAATGIWQPIEPGEMLLGAIGGFVGGLAYVFNRRIKDPLSAITSMLLAVAWCAALAPLLVHGAHLYYPELGAALQDAAVTLVVGGVLGAAGMELYVFFLAIMDALKKALPDKIDDIFERYFGGKK